LGIDIRSQRKRSISRHRREVADHRDSWMADTKRSSLRGSDYEVSVSDTSKGLPQDVARCGNEDEYFISQGESAQSRSNSQILTSNPSAIL